jgi:hypothetical protein
MSRSPANEVCTAARALGRRLAAAGALVVALAALLAHAPVWLACVRAAATLLVLLAASGIGTAALGWACACDAELEGSKEGAHS